MNKNIIIAVIVTAIVVVAAFLGFSTKTAPASPKVGGTDIVELYPAIFANGLRLTDDKTFLSSTCIEQVGTTTAGLRYYIQFVASTTSPTGTLVYATTTKPTGCF